MESDTTNEDFEFERPYLPCVVDRFEGDYAVCVVEGSQEIRIRRDMLPDKTEAGAPIRLVISNDQEESKEREMLAKAVLNEILQNSE